MDGGGGGIEESSNPQDLKPFGANPTGDTIFDASQYAFFDNNVVEEVELGGLEDEEDDLPPAGLDDEEFLLDREEGEALDSLSEIDDLAITFSKLNRGISEPIGDQRSRGSECSNIRLCMPLEINISTRTFYERTCQCFFELHPSCHGFLLSDHVVGHYNLDSRNMVEL